MTDLKQPFLSGYPSTPQNPLTLTPGQQAQPVKTSLKNNEDGLGQDRFSPIPKSQHLTIAVPPQAAKASLKDLEDGWAFAVPPPATMRDKIRELECMMGLTKPVPGTQPIGAVGSGAGAGAGALIGLLLGAAIWIPLGVTAIAVKREPYHSNLRGILFLAIGIPAFALIGALLGACAGGKSRMPSKAVELPRVEPNAAQQRGF